MKLCLLTCAAYRRVLATALIVAMTTPTAWTQAMEAITPVKSKAPLIGSYKAPFVPPINLANSSRFASLIRGGKLYLTAQDAIALALENNLDVEISRYNPILDQWRLVRSEAGGALPGVPSGSSQVSSVAQGQGVTGSLSSAGVRTSGGGTSGNGSSNTTISQIGPVTPALDPVVQNSTSFSHVSQPQPNIQASDVVNLVQNKRFYSTSIQQGILSGGQASLDYTESYLNENAPTDILNPSQFPTLSLSVQHNFLSGFGVGVNSRNIEVSKINLRIDDLNFKSEIISIVVNVLQTYYTYSADFLNVGARQRALDVAQEFLANNKKQVEIGTMAPLDVTNAESSVATSQQDLVIAQTTLAQDELNLKNLLSRIGTEDPLLSASQIIPLDHIEVPEKDDLPPLKDLISRAQASRVDIAAEKLNLNVAQLSAKGTQSGVLPQLVGFATLSNAGTSGKSQPRILDPQEAAQLNASVLGPCPASYHTTNPCEFADPSFYGGLGRANGQIFRRDFPSESGGVFFAARMRNRSNQADYAIDQLSMRQTEVQDAKDLNQIAVDVSNQVTALRQARARYLAAAQSRLLSQQLLDAEQKKFGLGASTPFNVVTQQRDLAVADYNTTSALVAYSNARVALDQTLGDTLEANHVSLDEAKNGRVTRISNLPDKLPQ
jgi:outer membrane protein TolC